jgi:hypothetical protein
MIAGIFIIVVSAALFAYCFVVLRSGLVQRLKLIHDSASGT